MKKSLHLLNLFARVSRHGIAPEELVALLRCERTLHSWAEDMCNGAIYRDDETGKPVSSACGRPVPDREAAALRRATAIARAHRLTVYYQSDPLGCALYLIRRGDVPAGCRVESYYTNGIAICI